MGPYVCSQLSRDSFFKYFSRRFGLGYLMMLKTVPVTEDFESVQYYACWRYMCAKQCPQLSVSVADILYTMNPVKCALNTK